jgi:regulatory protein
VTALRALARRDRSVTEIRRALSRRAYGPAEIEEVVERLRTEGLLDDSKLAGNVARYRMAAGLGRFRVRAELQRRGFAPESQDAGIRSALEEISETTLIDEAARHYWRANSRVEEGKRLERLHRFLLRKGFPASLVADRLRALFRGSLPEEEIP